MNARTILLFTLLALVAAISWWGLQSPLQAADQPRSLAEWQHGTLAFPISTPWHDELADALESAPALALTDPEAPTVVRHLLKQVTWMDPTSVQVDVAFPEGLRVRYQPRWPILRVLPPGGAPVYLSADATLLPTGVEGTLHENVFDLPLDPGVELPVPGRRLANALVQEGIRMHVDAMKVQEVTGLKVLRLERQEGYPMSAKGIPPAMTLVLDNGTQLFWGRSSLTRDPLGNTFVVKMGILGSIVRQYPGLASVSRIYLDRLPMKILDSKGEPLPFQDGVLLHVPKD